VAADRSLNRSGGRLSCLIRHKLHAGKHFYADTEASINPYASQMKSGESQVDSSQTKPYEPDARRRNGSKKPPKIGGREWGF